MRRKELSEIIKRGDEELRLSRAAAERHARAFERLMATFDRHERAFDRHEAQTGDLGVFIRDMNRRSEKVIGDLLRGNREFCKELTAKTDGKAEALMAELKDLREESQAQRQALLNSIDRLPPPPQAA